MTAGYQEFPLTEPFKTSHPKLLANDKSALSLNAGKAFPTTPLEGMYCYRTDTKVLYQYIDGKWAPAYGSPVGPAGSAGEAFSSADDIDRTGFYSISGDGMNCASNTSTLLHIERYWGAGTKKFQMNFVFDGRIFTRAGTVNADDSSKIDWTNWKAVARTGAGDNVSFGTVYGTSFIASAGTMLSSGNWANVDLTATSYTATFNKMLAQILDKNGKRWVGLETTGQTDGARSFQINWRNRADTGWVQAYKVIETTAGSITQTFAGDLIAKGINHFGYQFSTTANALTKGTTPSSNLFSYWSIYDKAGYDTTANRVGYFQHEARSDGTTYCGVFCVKPEAKSTDISYLKTGWDANKATVTITNAPIETNVGGNSWVEAAKGRSIIRSNLAAGSFMPLWNYVHTDGSSTVLAGFKDSIQLAHVTKANKDSATNASAWIWNIRGTDGALILPSALCTAGNYMHKDANRTDEVITFDPYDASGGAMWIKGKGGLTALGSGESVTALRTNLATYGGNYGTEKLYLTSDNETCFIVGANTWANRVNHTLGLQGLDTQEPDLVKGTAPTANTYTHLFLCENSGNASKNRLAGMEAWAHTNGSTAVCLRAYRSVAGSTEGSYLLVQKNADGTAVFQLSSSPADASNTTDIATTAWAKARDAEVESNLVTALNNLAKTWG
nr:MAG TPA: hypothetical protein [Caudoviricetes sp.]